MSEWFIELKINYKNYDSEKKWKLLQTFKLDSKTRGKKLTQRVKIIKY